MRYATYNKRLAAIGIKIEPPKELRAAIWLPAKPGETYRADSRLPLIIYNPDTGEPLPAYAALAARVAASTKLYGFNPDETEA